uniref:Thrombospondin-related anonymous protein n=1 Tax=Babesia motasi TaxID=237580 RepID=A0A221SSH5_9APIC|nr:thrombospondin-related anonymous protein [Babesia motasi]
MMGYGKLLALAPLVQIMLHYAAAVSLTVMGSHRGEDMAKHCKRQLDFSIIVDESASISRDDWNRRMIPFLEHLIVAMDLDNTDIKLSLTTYSTPVRSIITFLDKEASNTHLAIKKLHEMRDSKPAHGMTYTGHAISFVRQSILPYGRKNVPKALLLITDGGSSDPDVTAQEAAMLRDDGVTVLVIGVGDVRASECRGIVGCDGVMDCPMFKHTDWKGMIRLFYGLMKEVCDTLPQDAVCNPVWTEWSDCIGECNAAGLRRRTLVTLETVQKTTVGTNGKQGRTCEDQHNDFPPQEESCMKKCHVPKPKPHDIPAPDIGGKTNIDEPTPVIPPRPKIPGHGGDGRSVITDPDCPWGPDDDVGPHPGPRKRTDEPTPDVNPKDPSPDDVLPPVDPINPNNPDVIPPVDPINPNNPDVIPPVDPINPNNPDVIPPVDPINPNNPDVIPPVDPINPNNPDVIPPLNPEDDGDKDPDDDDDDNDDGPLVDDGKCPIYPINPGTPDHVDPLNPGTPDNVDPLNPNCPDNVDPIKPRRGDMDPINPDSHKDTDPINPDSHKDTDPINPDSHKDTDPLNPDSHKDMDPVITGGGDGHKDNTGSTINGDPSSGGTDDHKGDSGAKGGESGLPSQAELERQREKEREDDLKRELEAQRKMEQEAEEKMKHELSLNKNVTTPSEPATTTEATTEETSDRSSSNATKIAGGALLGLLLLGAGGGYAMYKRNKAAAPETDTGDYTGADEGEQPLRDAETYTVTEFDNNIWGEAT